MTDAALDTHQKAFQINLDPSKYGTFAEIGAGQEVARWFFRVGGASGTVAKTMSAYDMIVSDAIYGKSTRYVSRDRLQTMLEHEYGLLIERLAKSHGKEKKFFVVANTVAAGSHSRPGEGSGWLGIRFQHEPQVEPSELLIHIRLLDRQNILQQEAIGILGVNLVYGAYSYHSNPNQLLESLVDALSVDRLQVDVAKFSGPAFAGIDNRLIVLELVRSGLSDSTMFTSDGEVVEPSEVLYKKPILVERGSFQPLTNATADMLHCGLSQFIEELDDEERDKVVVVLEMTMSTLSTGHGIDPEDFLARVDMVRTLGHCVMVSRYFEFYRLAQHLFRYTKKKIGIVMGLPTLKEVFDDKYYTHLEGGILESVGRMFKNDLKLYIYPFLSPETGKLISADNVKIESIRKHLYAYLYEGKFIEPIRGFDERYLPIFTKDVHDKIKRGDPTWEQEVPVEVARMIKERGLLGCKQPAHD